MDKNTRRRRNFQNDKHVDIQLENKGEKADKRREWKWRIQEWE
jgi:hypothetical protein